MSKLYNCKIAKTLAEVTFCIFQSVYRTTPIYTCKEYTNCMFAATRKEGGAYLHWRRSWTCFKFGALNIVESWQKRSRVEGQGRIWVTCDDSLHSYLHINSPSGKRVESFFCLNNICFHPVGPYPSFLHSFIVWWEENGWPAFIPPPTSNKRWMFSVAKLCLNCFT